MNSIARRLFVALIVMMSITVVRSAEVARNNDMQLRGSKEQVHHVNEEKKEEYGYGYGYYYEYHEGDGEGNGAIDDDDEASFPEDNILEGYVEFYKSRHGNDNDRR